MKQAKLIFSPDGTSVHVKFSDGALSVDLKNEEEAFFQILMFQIEEKITDEESEQFLMEISLAIEKEILFQSKSFYESPSGFHRHKCGNCGHVWEHSDSCHGQKEPHICTNCHNIEGWRYFGPEAPVEKTN